MSEADVCEYSLLIKQGYLFKQSSYLKQWKSKWIVLKGFCLFTFNQKPIDHQTNDVLEIFDLTIYDTIQQIDQSVFQLLQSSSSSSSSSNHDNNTKFKANSNKEMIEWITKIRKQQNKININNNMLNDNDQVLLSSISQLIDDGFTRNEVVSSLNISLAINDQSTDDDDDDNDDGNSLLNVGLNTSFDPRSMFDSISSTTANTTTTSTNESKEELTTALLSAINENMDEKNETEMINIDCKDIINDVNYKKVSLSIQDILSIKNKNDEDKNENEDKKEISIKSNKSNDYGIFEMKSIKNNKSDKNKNYEDVNISDLCIVATKQLQLLQDEENENLIQIKKMNLIETLNKIKEFDQITYQTMIKQKQWSIFIDS